ncbi:retrovirus-related pol polyprotein from transposon TNT 1-94 [Tanacetum coccineum]
MDKSWMRTSRTKKQYIDGVEAFIKYAVHNLQKMRNIDPRATQNGINMEKRMSKQQLPKYLLMLQQSFDMDFGSEIPTDGRETVEMVNATKESFEEDDLAKFQELLLDAEKPFYKGCPDFTKLSAIVKLLNLKGKYGASDKFFTKLLGLLKKMLPAGNEMVENLSGQNTNENDGIRIQKDTGYIAEETIMEETIEFFSEYHKTMKTIGISPDKHNTYEIVSYIERHKQVLKTKNLGKRIALLENEHTKSFAKWLREEVERELAISKDSVSEAVRWISYGPRTTIVKHEAYTKEVATTRKAFYYGVLQEIWVTQVPGVNYTFLKILLFKCDWVNYKAGRVKHDPNLGYTLVYLNSLGDKDDPFILASQARQVFYVKDQIDKKLSIVFRTPTKNYKDTYDEVDEEFSIVIHEHNVNILPRVNRRDSGNESQNDYYRTDCKVFLMMVKINVVQVRVTAVQVRVTAVQVKIVLLMIFKENIPSVTTASTKLLQLEEKLKLLRRLQLKICME